jgi:dipeptide/tripeptide permease
VKSIVILYATTFFEIEKNNEIKQFGLVIVILISVFILVKLIKNKETKKEETKSALVYTIISAIITIFLFYNFFKTYL